MILSSADLASPLIDRMRGSAPTNRGRQVELCGHQPASDRCCQRAVQLPYVIAELIDLNAVLVLLLADLRARSEAVTALSPFSGTGVVVDAGLIASRNIRVWMSARVMMVGRLTPDCRATDLTVIGSRCPSDLLIAASNFASVLGLLAAASAASRPAAPSIVIGFVAFLHYCSEERAVGAVGVDADGICCSSGGAGARDVGLDVRGVQSVDDCVQRGQFRRRPEMAALRARPAHGTGSWLSCPVGYRRGRYLFVAQGGMYRAASQIQTPMGAVASGFSRHARAGHPAHAGRLSAGQRWPFGQVRPRSLPRSGRSRLRIIQPPNGQSLSACLPLRTAMLSKRSRTAPFFARI